MERFSGLRIPLLTIFSFFVILFLYTQLFGPITFKVNSQPNLFYVDGVGKETAVPTTASITLGVSETGSSVKIIQENLNRKTNTIVEELKKLGIPEKDIKTINYSLNPNYNFTPRLENTREGEIMPSEPEEISGYVGTQDIEVKVNDVSLANKAIDVATKNGANVVSGASFSVGEEEREELKDKAREEAIENAKSKAARITKASGLRLGKLVNVSESLGPIPYGVDQAVLKEEQQVSTQLNPGETTIEVSVTLTYETL